MLPKEYCNIEYKTNIYNWDDGLPLGNGNIGCLVWGNGKQLRLSIDKSDLWDCSGATVPGGDFTYSALRKLVAHKRKRKISKIFDTPYENPTPTKLPAGKIIIELEEKALDSSILNIAQAFAHIKAGNDEIETFVDAENPIGFIRSNNPIKLKIENPQYGKSSNKRQRKLKQENTKSLKSLQYEKAITGAEEIDGIKYKYFTQKINDELTYGIIIGILDNIAAYTVSLAKNKEKALNNAITLLNRALNAGYTEYFNKHKKWWENFWNESYVDLPDKYYEQKWYITNYLSGSCSREGAAPMPLQGIWTADNDMLPPWKGDYHFDLNVQFCYQSYMKANHLSCGKSYIDFLLRLQKNAERFSKEFYGVDGLCLPSVCDINGNALGGWAMYALSPANQAWLCHGMKEYCDYSADFKLLKERVYPYMKKYAEFLLAILAEDENGKLVFPLSSSPEIHDNTLKAWLKPNSNYDNSMLMRFFKDLIEIAVSLELASDEVKWKNVYSRLQPLAINKDDVLMISQKERLKHSHRHFSHLISVYPLGMLTYTNENKRVIDASVSDLEKLGTKEYCGYSFAWLANLYAVQKRGTDAAKMLKIFWQYFCLGNVFHVNGDYKKTGKSKITYRIFSLEGNFCAADALLNMLMQCDDNGNIELFPAVPEKWKNISFDLLAKNRIRIITAINNGELEYVKINSETNINVCILYKNKSKKVTVKRGVSKLFTADDFKD